MVRAWKVFPYGRNIAAVVSAVMDKDRQGAAQKRQAVVRLHEARPKRQRGAAKATVPGGGKPPLAAKSVVPASSRAPEAAAAAGGSKSAKATPASGKVPEAAKAARDLPSPVKHDADFATDICVDDYLVGKLLASDIYFLFFKFVDAPQGRTKANLLLFRLPRRPRRLPWCQGRRVVLLVPEARCRHSLLLGTRRALCPTG
jgi:hypothetical protein